MFFLYLWIIYSTAPLVLTTAMLLREPTALARWFDEMNQELLEYQQDAAEASWEAMIGSSDGPVSRNRQLAPKDIWRERKCKEAASFPKSALTRRHKRMIYLLCRGPKDTSMSLSLTTALQSAVSQVYDSAKICLKGVGCLRAEPELDLLMRGCRDPELRLAAWLGLRETGSYSRNNFLALMASENRAARAAGYNDMGQCWREELEIPRLVNVVEDLYNQIAPLYKLLHAFVRYRLGQYYGQRLVPMDGPMPAHLVGDMWSSTWDSMMDIVSPLDLGLDAAVRRLFPTARAMLKSAEDYYVSLGLPPMTRQFWEKSVISMSNTSRPATCHGAAANLFKRGDARMLLCTQINWEDYYVVHHEMGHIQYYRAYEDQPIIFQEGANSAVQETIGDAIMLAVRTPKHLQRKGILKNVTTEIEMSLMLTLALNKIPQLAYGIIVDRWRWDVMASKVDPSSFNELWWQYRINYQGVRPPVPRSQRNLDPLSKYHVAENLPYIRYFLSGFLQFQFLDVMCADVLDEGQPLYECDLYGSKSAGKKLRSLMEKGLETPWNEVLEEFSNGKYTTVSAEPLIEYFAPLKNYLTEQMYNLDIPIGW